MSDALDLVLGRLQSVKKVAGGWMATCPAHDDRTPSLKVAEGKDGRPLLHCHGATHCSYEKIIAALGLTPPDLSPNGNGASAITRRETARHVYEDANGRPLFEVRRFNTGTKCLPYLPGAVKSGIGDTPRPLYRLPHVLAAVKAGETIYVAEGEKDADALVKAGVVATSNAFGAGLEKWLPEHTATLTGAHVVIVQDRDEAGRNRGHHLLRVLGEVATSVRLVEPAVGKDAYDHLRAGRTVDELVPVPSEDVSAASAEEEVTPTLTFQTVEEFAAFEEPGAEPLVRDAQGGAAIAAGSTFVFYGTGGAGKTTMVADMLFQWAAGRSWLGLLTPAKPLRIVLIEDEGPRPMLRAKLRRKLASFDGALEGRIEMLTEPWARFTFRDQAQAEELAAHLAAVEADLLIAGPVHRLGMQGGGTADEIDEFMQLVEDVQRAAGGRVAVGLIHHENRAGQVSGAWEGVPDTLAHVQALGHGRTRVFWQKTRWSSTLHGTTMSLAWAAGESFTIEEREEFTEATMADEILAAAIETPGNSWTQIRERVSGHATDVARVRDRLLAEGVLVNTATRRGYFSLWDANDPAVPTRSEAGTGLERLPFPSPDGAAEASRSPVPALSRNGERNGTAEPGPADENGTDSDPIDT